MRQKIKLDPRDIVTEYREGSNFKAGIGDHGIFEQTKINERFYIGDQWHGAKCGNTRPLVRRNLIKRIGEYKLATITAAPIAVNYSADGVPETVDIKRDAEFVGAEMRDGTYEGGNREAEISVIMQALSDYFTVTAERLKFDAKKEQALRNAYISGTALAFTYWDSDTETGLYADEGQTKAIKGDIAFEIIDVENVVFGDPNNDDIQTQPYIIIAQRRHVSDVRREAKRNGVEDAEIYSINPDNDYQFAASGDLGDREPADSQRATVYTKLYKEWDDECRTYKVMAVRCTDAVTIREPWDIGIRLYPLAKMNWERRRSCAYGESEITYLVPNQIAVNRALSSTVWSMMMKGMPVMVVNGDVVPAPITNEPGEIVKVYAGQDFQLSNAVHYVSPPAFEGQQQNMIDALASATLSDSGANDAALGNLRPDNASAIIQMREAAMAPLQTYVNRFYDFIEDIARIWADFWLNLYGNRSLKISDKSGTWYMPFNADKYKNLLISAKIDVGAATLWSESVVVSTLDNLLKAQLITFDQYLERIPDGIIPDVTGLRNDLKSAAAMQGAGGEMPTEDNGEISDEEIIGMLQAQYPEQYEQFMNLSPEEQAEAINAVRASAGATGGMAQ